MLRYTVQCIKYIAINNIHCILQINKVLYIIMRANQNSEVFLSGKLKYL